ncbi:hypothetical protein LTR72_002422 [Exophiala xenobiotica]|nr:hypothetical protein LTR41_003915 [Exophiala xenobiotica]KAK5228538.1 hypothetical protein LTR72_002422 [Exophiala xenobiotica]KAK5302025.1 hypothetical protein LTR14_000273 [Exophiala xenobiotica]KAK5325690.1 hypothetical protein LTR93_003910 [Exophiala xenobiotica]KAK5387853.1 hypothetical protein LTS13_000789 [Exophiala xenobiotica]
MTRLYQRLLGATRNDVNATNDIFGELRKGAINSRFPGGPGKTRRPARYTANFGMIPNFDANVSVLAQLPMEILISICSNLEPIWVFQLELTCTKLATRLRSSDANRLWYGCIPAALKALPEFFQDSAALSQRGVDAPFEFNHPPNPHGGVVAQSAPWSTGGLDSSVNKFFNLPALRSVNMTDPMLMYLVHHLKGNESIGLAQYAVVRSQHGYRIKTLALGIHYQINFNYRREMLGHFLLTRRCIACLEAPEAAGTPVRPDQVWQDVGGMNMCPTCFSKYTVRNEELCSVPGLLRYLYEINPQSNRLGPWLPERCRPWAAQEIHWRPLIDDFVRQKCGLDTEMLIAKQEYFDWLRDTLKGQSSSVYNGRQTIRRDVIRIAQRYWSKPWPDEVRYVQPQDIHDLRNTVVPTDELAEFLFPPEKLDRDALSPRNLEGLWPTDPADILRYQRDVLARTERWKEQQAQLMLYHLVVLHRGAPLLDALENHHTRRTRDELTTTAIMARVAAGPQANTLVLTEYKTKLFLDTDPAFAGNAVLTYAGSAAARSALGPLVQESVGCLVPGCRLAPRGVEAMVKHMRVEHEDVFFGSWDWVLA